MTHKEMLNPESFNMHPLGFFYAKHQVSELESFRVHVYIDGIGARESNEWHTHEFDLHSEVRLGVLRNEVGSFVERVGGRDTEYEVRYEGSRSMLEPTGRHGLIEESLSFDSGPNSEYVLRSGVLHRASVLVFPVVTFVKTTHVGKEILSYGDPEPPFDRRPANERERTLIAEVINYI